MTDITLTPIVTGYNLSKINDNFTELERVINDELLHLVGGNNVMQQDIDMNSNDILNVNVLNAQSITEGGVSIADQVAAAAASAAAASASEAASGVSEVNAAGSESAAAASAAAASAAVAQLIWRDVIFKGAGDSPVTVVQDDSGKLFACDTSAGDVVINLPEINTLSLPYTVGVKKTSVDGNKIIVNRSGSDTIDGVTSVSVQASEAGYTLVADTDPAPDEWTSMAFGATGGDIVVDSFVDAVDYTSGTTTQLTLSAAPGTATNITITFDGVAQHTSTFSVAGQVVTFTSPIPLGVSEVEARIGITVALGIPADDSVITDSIQDNAVTTPKIADGAVTASKLDVSVLQAIYPVGSVYINATVETSPATLLGFGTWARVGAGRVMVDSDIGDPDFDVLGETGGAKTHTLTEAEMPAHTHNYTRTDGGNTNNFVFSLDTDGAHTTVATSSTGGNAPHNNVQPYVVVAMWKRTA